MYSVVSGFPGFRISGTFVKTVNAKFLISIGADFSRCQEQLLHQIILLFGPWYEIPFHLNRPCWVVMDRGAQSSLRNWLRAY